MTENTNHNNEGTTAQGAKGPKVVKHLDVRIQEARENVAAAQVKLDKLLAEKANEGKLDAIAAGEKIKFNFGRGEKARTLEGTVLAAETGKGSSNKLKVLAGEGFDATSYDITAAAVIFDAA